jgi:hypothetical protein
LDDNLQADAKGDALVFAKVLVDNSRGESKRQSA